MQNDPRLLANHFSKSRNTCRKPRSIVILHIPKYSTRTKVFVRPYQNVRYLNSCTCRSPFPMASTGVPGHKNRSDRTEMTDYDKGRIDAYKDIKLNSTEISERVDRPASIIRSYLQKRRTHGYQNLPRSGWPPKISDRSFCIL